MFDYAIAACKKALKLQPDLISARGELFRLYTIKGMRDKAASVYLEMKPEHVAYYQLGKAYVDEANASYGVWYEEALDEAILPTKRQSN